MEKLGLEFSPPPSADTRPWTKARMVAAFGDFLDGSIIDFAQDMAALKMTESDIFEAVQIAMAHNLGCVERARSFIHDSKDGKEDIRNMEFVAQVGGVSKLNTKIGWDHKDFHLTNKTEKCVDPYKVGEGDEDSPSAA